MTRERRDQNALPVAESGEADRHLGGDLPPDPTVLAQGWEWRCNADARREREIVDTYRELGFEVRVEPVDLELLCADCDGCKEAPGEFNAIYVRRPAPDGRP